MFKFKILNSDKNKNLYIEEVEGYKLNKDLATYKSKLKDWVVVDIRSGMYLKTNCNTFKDARSILDNAEELGRLEAVKSKPHYTKMCEEFDKLNK